MRVGRKRALAALTVAAAAWLAPSAAAGDQPRLVEVGGAHFPKRAFVLTLPGKRSLTAGDVRVLENGEPVSELSLAPAGSSGGEESGVVLLIDASESMAGAPIKNAMAAARAFAAQRMPSQQLAVLAYNAHTETVLPFTSEPRPPVR